MRRVFISGALLVALGFASAVQAEDDAVESEVPANADDGQQPSDAPRSNVNQDIKMAVRAAAELKSLQVPGAISADDAVRLALGSSPDVMRAQAAIREARAGAKEAMAALVPRLNFRAGYTRLSPVTNGGITSGGAADNIRTQAQMLTDPVAQALWEGLADSFSGSPFPVILDQWSLTATASWSITGALAQALPAYRAARIGKDGAQWQVTAARHLVALQAREAYYEYARARAASVVAEKSLDQANAELRDVKTLVDAGAAARVDEMRVQARQASAKVAFARAGQGQAVAREALRTLLHTEEPVDLGEDLSSPVGPVPDAPLESLEQRAYTDRPDLVALNKTYVSRKRALRAAKGQQLFDLSVQANAQYANPNQRIFPQSQEFNGTWDVSAVLSWSPNDTVAGSGAADRARANLTRVRADLIALQDAVHVEVARGYHGMAAARAAIEAGSVGLVAAEESYRVRREQLKAGVVNTTDLLEAEADLTRARLDLVDAAVGLRLARAALLHAIGVQP